MPRSPRLLLSQSYYHVMTRGNNQNVIFRKDKDFRHYLDIISRLKEEHLFEIFHYCLMPNHTHFLIKTRKGNEFFAFIKKVWGSVGQRYNEARKTKYHLN
ncbi:transposase [Patescibacteria group bacterium]